MFVVIRSVGENKMAIVKMKIQEKKISSRNSLHKSPCKNRSTSNTIFWVASFFGDDSEKKFSDGNALFKTQNVCFLEEFTKGTSNG